MDFQPQSSGEKTFPPTTTATSGGEDIIILDSSKVKENEALKRYNANLKLFKKNRYELLKDERYHPIGRTRMAREMNETSSRVVEGSRRYEIPVENGRQWRNQHPSVISEMERFCRDPRYSEKHERNSSSDLQLPINQPFQHQNSIKSVGQLRHGRSDQNGSSPQVPSFFDWYYPRNHIPSDSTATVSGIAKYFSRIIDDKGEVCSISTNSSSTNHSNTVPQAMEREIILRDDDIWYVGQTLLPIVPLFKSSCLRSSQEIPSLNGGIYCPSSLHN